MDHVREFLSQMLQTGRVKGNFLGLLNIAIGRRISRVDGTLLSTGMTWRALANALKQCQFDAELVRELGIDPEILSSREAQRFWYAVIARADIASQKATLAGDRLAELLANEGFIIGSAPGGK